MPILCGSEPPDCRLWDILDLFTWSGFDALLVSLISTQKTLGGCQKGSKNKLKSKNQPRVSREASMLQHWIFFKDGEPELGGE